MNTQISKTRSAERIDSLDYFREKTRRAASSPTAPRPIENEKLAVQAAKIERYARTNHHVLLTGERGTGKTTIARQIHDKSIRSSKNFVSLNCATLKEELVEAELFGHEKGAFTGADKLKLGLFETGSGGTVFLDEIGELSLNLQAKLLKAVEERKIRRVGASAEITIDLRIIAATSRDLPAMVATHEFRADLYDRLNILSLDTVPLREQPDKIIDLIVKGLERERLSLGRKKSYKIAPKAFRLLENYSWTGNFRELQNFVVKLSVECFDGEIILPETIAALLGCNVRSGKTRLILEINPDEHLDAVIERVKELYIRHHLQSKNFRQIEVQCGISRNMVRRVAKKNF